MSSGINLKDMIGDILEEYGEEVLEVVQEEAPKAAKNAVKKLKQKKKFAPGSEASGKYAAGWSSVVEKQRMGVNAIAYNAKYSSLTHLLENGHVSKNGTGRVFGHVKAYPHIEQVNEETQMEFVKAVERRVGE